MIYIRNAAGVALLIDADQKLTLEQQAGWLADDTLPGAKSYPIEFPLAPNEAFLQSGYRPDAAKPVMEFAVTAQFQNVLYRRCLFSYETNEGKGSGYLKIDGGEVFTTLRKLKLKDAFATPIYLGTSPLLQLSQRMGQIAQLPPGQFPLTFFPLRNEGFFEDSLDETKIAGFVRQPYVNAWTSTGFKTDTSAVKGYPVVPFFYLSWVLQQIFAKAGYSVEGDWLTDPDVQRLVILNQTAISTHQVTLFSPIPHFVTPGMHLPDMTVADFLKGIRQRFGLIYTFNSTTQVVIIRSFTAVIRSRPIDLTPYVVGKDAYGIKPPSNQGFSVVDFVDSNDELYRDTNNQVITPDGLVIGGTDTSDRQEVKLSVGSCQMVYETGFLENTKWTLPTLRLAGNTLDKAYATSDRYVNTDGSLRNGFSLRVISYLGNVASSNGAVYPLGSAGDKNGQQVSVINQSASLLGQKGLWQTILKYFYYFRDQTREVSLRLNLPTGLAASLTLHQPIALSLTGQARRSYLIEKLQSESPGPGGLMVSRLYALSIPDGLDMPIEPVQSHFYVKMSSVQGNPISVSLPMPLTFRLTTYSISYWLDQAMTRPAGLVDRTINLRRIRKGIPGAGNAAIRVDFHEESVIAYPAVGNGGALDPVAAGCAAQSLFSDIISYYLPSITQRTPQIDAYTLTLQLDPGDGYTILS